LFGTLFIANGFINYFCFNDFTVGNARLVNKIRESSLFSVDPIFWDGCALKLNYEAMCSFSVICLHFLIASLSLKQKKSNVQRRFRNHGDEVRNIGQVIECAFVCE